MLISQAALIQQRFDAFFPDPPNMSVSDWCVENLVFHEPENTGPFSLVGRDYIRQPLDEFADSSITDVVEVFGSQAGKTAMLMGGMGWTIANRPMRCMWVMPNENKARGFSKKRWQPMLLHSPVFDPLIPTGARRHDFATMSQMLGRSIVDFQGSNSPTNLASDPCSYVIQDETDKFNEGTKAEANASELADQRTKGQKRSKRIKTSTPTIEEGLIWQAFLKTDQRRRWVPCPHCNKFVVLVWSKQFTVFDITGHEAEVKWDSLREGQTLREGHNAGAGEELERAERSARFECPHCGGHIRDEHKTRMDREGEWRPSAKAAKGFVGRHLPSLYVNLPETRVGKLVVKFLQAKNSLLGLQGFINGDLAEPFLNQDTRSERVEIVTESLNEEPGTKNEEPIRLMAVDCQGRAPFFWYAVREFKDGNSLGLSAGPLDTWEEVEDKQREFGVKDGAVVVDSGFGARNDAEVYRVCARHCEVVNGYAVGWMPSKGQPTRKRWRDKKTGFYVPWFAQSIDPFLGTSEAGRVCMDLFEFSGDFFKDILEALRQGKGAQTWAVTPEVDNDEYWRHMDGEVKTATRNAKTGAVSYGWQPRSKHWPNHILDCEVMILATANFLGLMQLEPNTKNEEQQT